MLSFTVNLLRPNRVYLDFGPCLTAHTYTDRRRWCVIHSVCKHKLSLLQPSRLRAHFIAVTHFTNIFLMYGLYSVSQYYYYIPYTLLIIYARWRSLSPCPCGAWCIVAPAITWFAISTYTTYTVAKVYLQYTKSSSGRFSCSSVRWMCVILFFFSVFVVCASIDRSS